MKVVVIGGGASGMVASYFLRKNGHQVTLIEKNEKLGKKLYITGKGRCNLTNDCDVETFLENVVTNKKFMLGAIYGFTPSDTMAFFESLGLTLKTERGNRVFPISDKSSDVIKVLEKALIATGVDIRLNETVLDIDEENGSVKGVKTNLDYYFIDKVVIATGGISYSSTGSTGDGYKFAKKFGHSVTDLKPSLCGFNIKGEEYKALQGLGLKNVTLTAFDNGKCYYKEMGEILFTHFGISGPLVLSCSALTCKRNLKNVELYIDLKPALSDKELDSRILRDFSLNKNKEFKNSLDALLPKALIPLIVSRSNIDGNKKNNIITKEERQNLVKVLKNLKFSLASLRDFSEAVITSGGVSVKEINPSNMESKLVKNLHFIGEVLDVDAFTGGFNLQIAFSTAKCCSEN